MKSHEYYKGREQTYLKHFFLERYLERVAYNIFSFQNEFVYVDGFSGPWKSNDEKFEDTSFVIAINELRKIKTGFAERGKNVRIRCMFIEKNSKTYSDLQHTTQSISDIEIKTVCGSFEDLIPEIVNFVGTSFSLVFINPTGWTGYGLKKITPLLKLRGEVIINFMFDYINRFISNPRPETAHDYDPLYGDSYWYDEYSDLVAHGASREDAVLGVYKQRVRAAGTFPHITSTRIKKPLHERAYFHLVYATRHWKGLVEFSEVERKAADEQEIVRDAAQLVKRENRTGMRDLLSDVGMPTEVISKNFEDERKANLEMAEEELRNTLEGVLEIKYEKLLGIILEIPLVWVSDFKAILMDLKNADLIEFSGFTERQRVPKPGNIIRWIA